MKKDKLCVWLFCKVIDNFGDIGVSWRLAQQLVTEQDMTVVLWVDDWKALQTLLPEASDQAHWYEGVCLQPWLAQDMVQSLPSVIQADAVIETFACELPPEVVQWMTSRAVIWLNLEYLTAESWVDGIHLLPSLQSNGIAKYFFCPGFSPQTGGLSYEQALLSQATPVSEILQIQLRERHALPHHANSVHVYVFGYADEMWCDWLTMWLESARPITLWVTQGALLQSLQQSFAWLLPLQRIGDVVQCGQVTVCVVPFVAQKQFDEVLQAADVCVVRGEDSVLRALWQGRVFWWQIYRQQDDAHHDKLHAFWHKLAQDTDILQAAALPPLWQAHQLLSDELNGVRRLEPQERAQAWQYVCEHQADLAAVLQKWRHLLWDRPSLATQLANFIRLQLK